MPPIKRTSYLINGTRPHTHLLIISVHPTFTLRHLYARTPLASIIDVPLVRLSKDRALTYWSILRSMIQSI